MIGGNIFAALLVSIFFESSVKLAFLSILFLSIPVISSIFLLGTSNKNIAFTPFFGAIITVAVLIIQLLFSIDYPYFELSFLVLASNTGLRLASDSGAQILYPFSNRTYSLNIYKDIKKLNAVEFFAYFSQKKVILMELSLLFAYLYYAKVNILLNYFIFMTVSSTLIPLPSDAAVVAAGASQITNMATIAIIGGIGNVIGATLDYYIGMNLPKNGKFYPKIEPYLEKFKKRAFFWIIFGGFTPFPFEPFRLASGYVKYDLKKYWLAVFLSRTPRFYLLAWLGYDVWKQLAYYFI